MHSPAPIFFAVSSSKTQFNIETTILFKENTVCTSLINKHRILGASLAQGMYNSLPFFIQSLWPKCEVMVPTSHSGLLKFQQERSWLAVIAYTCCASLFYAFLTLTVLVNFHKLLREKCSDSKLPWLRD